MQITYKPFANLIVDTANPSTIAFSPFHFLQPSMIYPFSSGRTTFYIGQPILDILVNSFNLTESVTTQQVEVSVGSEIREFPILQDKIPHFYPSKLIVYNYADIEMILWPDVFMLSSLSTLSSTKSSISVDFRMPIDWVLNGPLFSPMGVLAPIFS